MIRRHSVLGALLLCALGLCAFGASSASATTLYVCQEVTKGTGSWEDSKCEKSKAGGNFGTVAAPENTTTEVAGATTGTLSIEIAALTGGAASILCNKQSLSGKATNQTVGGVMQSVGTATFLELSECSMPTPPGQECKVKQPIKSKELTSTTFMKTESETRVKFSPASGTTFMELTVEGCKSLSDMTLVVSGSLVGIPSGSSMVFTKESSMEGPLVVGGQAFTLSGSLAMTAKGSRTMIE